MTVDSLILLDLKVEEQEIRLQFRLVAKEHLDAFFSYFLMDFMLAFVCSVEAVRASTILDRSLKLVFDEPGIVFK